MSRPLNVTRVACWHFSTKVMHCVPVCATRRRWRLMSRLCAWTLILPLPIQIVEALNSLNSYEESLAAYEQAIRLYLNDAIAYYNKGWILNNLKHYEEALEAYEQAIRLHPNDGLAYLNKGNSLYNLCRYE